MPRFLSSHLCSKRTARVAAERLVSSGRRHCYTVAAAALPSSKNVHINNGSAHNSNATPSSSSVSAGDPHHHPSLATSTREKWENLEGLLMAAKPAHPHDVFEDKPLAIGRLTEKISDTVYKVKFYPPSPSNNAYHPEDALEGVQPPVTLPLGTRAKLFYGSSSADGMVMGGIIVKVNGNGTYTMLMDNDEIELSVAPDRACEKAEPTKILHNAKFLEVVEWLRPTIKEARECEAVAFILYYRGWRVERLFLLEKVDVSLMAFISRTERAAILEKSQWERDHHNVVRLLHRERVKDRDARYALSKYKGTISCISGILVVSYVFTANLSAYRKQQRGYQLNIAAKTLANAQNKNSKLDAERPLCVHREEEEKAVREMLQNLDVAHSRIIVFTGFSGCGKSSLCRSAITKEDVPAIFVDVHDSEDTLRSVVKALGVQNVDVCGDLLDFVSEAMSLATHEGRIPVLAIKLREGTGLQRVYKEAVGLVSDRKVCHLVFEVPIESLTTANMALPRLDFYNVSNFTRIQAFEYTQHMLDPLDLFYFIEVVGTNSNDLDELFAAVRQRGVDAVSYTSLKLMKAMRRLQAAIGNDEEKWIAVQQLASMPSDCGLTDDTVENFTILKHPSLKDVVLYDPVHDRWLFTSHVFHTAARCYQEVK